MGTDGRGAGPGVGFSSFLIKIVMALKILSVVGARPNFMKVAAICEAIKGINSLGAAEQIHHVLVHTGQHYDQQHVGFVF